MHLFSHEALQNLVSTHGYWVIALVVGLESMGIPLPGETILVLAAIYAAADPTLNIWLVIVAACVGSIMGDNLGYWVGKRYAYVLLLRYGRHIGMTPARIKLGQYLFREHGGLVVFLGRFVALLRILAAFLAGVNRMRWRNFLVANAAGGILWAATFGFGGYFFGKILFQMHSAVAPVVFVLALGAFFGVGYVIHRYEHRLLEEPSNRCRGPWTASSHAEDHDTKRLEIIGFRGCAKSTAAFLALVLWQHWNTPTSILSSSCSRGQAAISRQCTRQHTTASTSAVQYYV